MDKSRVLLKSEIDDFELDFEIMAPFLDEDPRKTQINQEKQSIDDQLAFLNDKVVILNSDIENLTNHADGLDYTAAIASGIFAGLIDSFFVGKWDFENAKAISNQEINDKIMTAARKEGYTGDRLSGAINKLEEKFKLPGDSAWNGLKKEISAKTHHLDDFSHHPTPIGLVIAILTQFTETGYYSNSNSEFFKIPIAVNERSKLIGKTLPAKIFCGIINWCIDVVKTSENWLGHMMSDMAGSKNTAGSGMGLPGPIMSMLKELSALPLVKNTDFAKNLSHAFVNGIGAERNQLDLGIFNNLFEGASSKVDLRTENAIAHELKRQALPVVINECLVRGFFFIRKFVSEIKDKKRLDLIDWKSTLPFKNRTIVRMLTISSGTFMAIDLADATIRAAIEAKGFNPATAGAFILRVNFVGVGRFAVACTSDVYLGSKKARRKNERFALGCQQLNLLNAKTFYNQADMWISAEATEQGIKEACEAMKSSLLTYLKDWQDIQDEMKKIGDLVPAIETKNQGLSTEINDILIWG